MGASRAASSFCDAASWFSLTCAGTPSSAFKLSTASFLPFGIFTLRDARPFFALTSKISPLDAMLNFDADVKKTTQCNNSHSLAL